MKKNPILSTQALLVLPIIFAATTIAAPLNDNFANAFELTGPSPVAVGDNTGATLEPGEFLPDPGNNGDDGIAGASVWYKWTAPADGWTEVTTYSDNPDHDLDTVIVLHRDATTPGPDSVMGFNDVFGYEDSYQSGLVFFAEEGVEYHVAVHGYFGQEGGFQLRIQAVDKPPIVVRELEFSPSPVDVADAAEFTTATFRIENQEPFEAGVADLYRPSGRNDYVSGGYFVGADRISGSELDGIYEVDLTVPRYSPPGNYPFVLFLWSESESLEWSTPGSDQIQDYHLIPYGAPLVVENDGDVDIEAPLIVSLSGLPANLDLSEGPVQVTLTLRITDNLSGLAYGYLDLGWLDAPDEESDVRELAFFDALELANGDENDGTYVIDVTIPGFIPDGEWALIVSLVDESGNFSVYGPAEEDDWYAAFPEGSTSRVIVGEGGAGGFESWPILATLPADKRGPLDRNGSLQIQNLMAYAMGIDPLTATADDLPRVANVDPAAGHASFRYRRAKNAVGVTLAPMTSTDLVGWQPATIQQTTVIHDGGDWEVVEIRVPAPPGGKLFFQLMAQ